MANTQNFDVIVIGGGPGGYVAAIRAAQLGLSACVVEREHLGGICLNWGCIPTKALLRAAELRHNLDHLEEYGIEVTGDISVNIDKVVKRSRKVASRLSAGVAHLLKKNKVHVVSGTASIAGKQAGKWAVAVAGETSETLGAKHVIIATRARSNYLSWKVMAPLFCPIKRLWCQNQFQKSLLVVGSGAIGIEFASFYRDMGVEVTVVEALDRILNAEDEEVSAAAHKAFEKRGMKIHVSASLKSLTETKSGVDAAVEIKGKQQTISVEKVIMAVGIVGNTEGLGLESTKVKIDRGHIETDSSDAHGRGWHLCDWRCYWRTLAGT